jgi:putative ABC transport system permease protein
MSDSLYLARRYIGFNRWKTLTLMACITLITVLPLTLQVLLTETERQMLARAASTPLVVGAGGSALDLMMSTLYFGTDVPKLINMSDSEEIWETGLADAIPLYVRFRARDYPIVGTTLDYFDFRGLGFAAGRPLAVLGECVLGAEAARRLELEPGDSLVSSPDNLFDLAGVYPLKMSVAGVLERTYSADDLAVFVDLKTAWIIEGLGHGHGDVARDGDTSVVLERSEDNVVANASLVQYTEITKANIDSFHFHGELENYSISAVIALPHDVKSSAILRGRFLESLATTQIVVPSEVIGALMQNIFRIKNVLDAVIVVVGLATVLAIALVFALSLRLRQREIQTIFKLGCQRATIAHLLAAEIILILFASGVLCVGILLIVDHYSADLVRLIFVN